MDKVMAQLEGLVAHYEELQEMMADPEVINDTKRYMEISKEEADLREVVQKYKKYKKDKQEIADNKEIIASETDADLIEMAKEENAEIEKEIPELEDQIKILMLPKDPNDDKDIIMEIHGAAGGDEASLFAGDLLRMYEKYAERQNWKVSMIDSEPTEVGGYKRVAIMITGDKVYSKLKYENGAHRVQRIPVTESQGRVHTSTATVAVMPEYEQVDIDIDPKDIRVDVYRSSGAGGLIRAYSNATSNAIEKVGVVRKVVQTELSLKVSYSAWGKLQNYLENNQVNVNDTVFMTDVTAVVYVDTPEVESFTATIVDLMNGQVEVEEGQEKYVEVPYELYK